MDTFDRYFLLLVLPPSTLSIQYTVIDSLISSHPKVSTHFLSYVNGFNELTFSGYQLFLNNTIFMVLFCALAVWWLKHEFNCRPRFERFTLQIFSRLFFFPNHLTITVPPSRLNNATHALITTAVLSLSLSLFGFFCFGAVEKVHGVEWVSLS